MTPDEFRKKLSEWQSSRNSGYSYLPDFIMEYIESLEKKAGKKKTVYTVRHIYQHDMDIEHRKVYSGTDAKKAFEKCYEQFQWIEDTREDYRYPFNNEFKKKFPDKNWYETHFTGLQVKQFFIDFIKNAIENKQSISFDLQYNGDFDPEDEGEAGGFELDITEV